jgi:hypothetical protein
MKEDFLHFVWKFKLFNSLNLSTTEGEPITILKNGIHNHHSGPDFSGATIKIGDKLWSGNVEIHIKSSDWIAHSHQTDPAYKNVILHVVFNDDKEIYLDKPGDLPVLELENYISADYLENYQHLTASKAWIPCASQFPKVDEFKTNQFLESLVVKRLLRKSRDILRIYLETDKDWNETFYRWIARSFGFKINSEAFETLTASIPLKLIKKHANSVFQVEALLFGQAGFLDADFEDDYPNKLKQEYNFLAKKYALQRLNPVIWKFSKTHPPNFPTKRISQLAAFLCVEQSTFSKLLILDDFSEIKESLRAMPNEYWKNHYRFDKPSAKLLSGAMGKSSIDNLIINSISTILYAYGQKVENYALVERSIAVLEGVRAESNSIITNWKKIGFEILSAKKSQALIELKRENCEKKKCLSCLFGMELIKSN